MLVIPIKKIEDFDRAQLLGDLVEFRLDLFDSIDLKKLKTFPLSEVVFTLRKKEQGGHFKGSEKEREEVIKSLLELNPGYFDLEADMDPHFIQEAMKNHPKTTFIGSYHNFIETPIQLPFDSRFPIFKLATLAKSTIDSLRVLKWIQEHRGRVSGIAMGEKGFITRILGKPSGSVLSYAALDSETETAPGQIPSKELKEIYRFDELNEKTAFYSVIGKPVNQSRGHIIHNNLMREKEINGVYVKMEVDPSEISHFLPLAKEVGFKGLSVTMPLKESVVPFMQKLHGDARDIQSVNTIKINDLFEGYNTDGIGALKTLGCVKNKRVIILGAGGASKAISYKLRQAGASVIILNRTKKANTEPLEKIEHYYREGYDILINTTPEPLPIDPKYILQDALLMDIRTRHFENSLLSYTEKGINGLPMYIHQASFQDQIWFNIDPEEAYNIIKKSLE